MKQNIFFKIRQGSNQTLNKLYKIMTLKTMDIRQ